MEYIIYFKYTNKIPAEFIRYLFVVSGNKDFSLEAHEAVESMSLQFIRLPFVLCIRRELNNNLNGKKLGRSMLINRVEF